MTVSSKSINPMLIEKPWGYYTDIYRPEDKKVVFKKIVVDPSGQLSEQYHKERMEFWYVAKGEGVITIDNFDLFVSEGCHVVIQPNEKHMVKNTGVIPLEIYETQAGQCDEKDIVRLSDIFGRSNE